MGEHRIADPGRKEEIQPAIKTEESGIEEDKSNDKGPFRDANMPLRQLQRPQYEVPAKHYQRLPEDDTGEKTIIILMKSAQKAP